MVSSRAQSVSAVVLASLLLAGGAVRADDPTRPGPGVDQARIDAACKKAGAWLLERVKGGLPPLADKYHLHEGQTYKEICLYALLYAGNVSASDPDMIKLAQETCDYELSHTYGAAIRAQALNKFDPEKFKGHIRNCIQFLVDNQDQQGNWGYSEKVQLPKNTVPTLDPKTYTGGGKGALATGSAGFNTSARSVVARRGWGKGNDNSNSQYALLGLAAGMSAGLWPPSDTFTLADKWFGAEQNNDGGWCYKEHGGGSYGSMTAGGVSSLAICLRGKGNNEPWKDVRIQKALKWLGENFNFANNPGGDKRWHYYWIYAVERAGSCAGVEWFGDRAWFKEGAEWLLGSQNGDGTWGEDKDIGDKISDTCFAVLFLRRATRGIVYSGAHK
jgi:hypothetical protein